MDKITITLCKLVSIYFLYVLVISLVNFGSIIDTFTTAYNSEMFASIVRGPIGVNAIVTVLLCLSVIPLELSILFNWKYAKRALLAFHLLVLLGVFYPLIWSISVVFNFEASVPISKVLYSLWPKLLLGAVSISILGLLYFQSREHSQLLKKNTDKNSPAF